jgi:hypothetical protein
MNTNQRAISNISLNRGGKDTKVDIYMKNKKLFLIQKSWYKVIQVFFIKNTTFSKLWMENKIDAFLKIKFILTFFDPVINFPK